MCADVCVQTRAFTIHLSITQGQHFQMLYPEAWIHWVFVLKLVYLDLKTQPFSPAQIDFLSSLSFPKLFSWQLLLLWDFFMTPQHLLGIYLPLLIFSHFHHHTCKFVNSISNKTLAISSKTRRIDHVDLCLIWKVLIRLNFQCLLLLLLTYANFFEGYTPTLSIFLDLQFLSLYFSVWYFLVFHSEGESRLST